MTRNGGYNAVEDGYVELFPLLVLPLPEDVVFVHEEVHLLGLALFELGFFLFVLTLRWLLL